MGTRPGGGGGGVGWGEVSENLNNHFVRNYWPASKIIYMKCKLNYLCQMKKCSFGAKKVAFKRS